MRMPDRGDGDPGCQIEDPAAVAGHEPASLPVIDLEPGVVAEDRGKDAGGALFEAAGNRSHRTSLGARNDPDLDRAAVLAEDPDAVSGHRGDRLGEAPDPGPAEP